MVDVLWHMQLFPSLQAADGGAFRSQRLGDKSRHISIVWGKLKCSTESKEDCHGMVLLAYMDEFRQRAITCHDATRFLGGVALRSEH